MSDLTRTHAVPSRPAPSPCEVHEANPTPLRQTPRRVRRHGRLRPPRRRAHDLLGPLRAAASRAGVRRHRRLRRQRRQRHQGHGPRQRDLHRRRPRPPARRARHRPHPLLHHRRLRAAQRPAHLGRIHQGPHRHRAQRQSRQPRHLTRTPRPRRRRLPDHLRHRDHRPAHRALQANHPRRLHRRLARPGRRRLLHRHDDAQPHLRRARPPRLPPALHGPHPRRQRHAGHLRLRLRDLRLRPPPRQIRARRRARRARHGLRRRRHLPPLRPRDRPARQLHL